MEAFAKELSFTGPAHGFDTSIIDPKDGTYVEYRVDHGPQPVKIIYKRNEKMEYTEGGPQLPFVQFGRERVIPASINEEARKKIEEKKIGDDHANETRASKSLAKPSPRLLWFRGDREIFEVDYATRLETFNVS